MRSLKSSSFILPKVRMRSNFAGRLSLTWSCSLDLKYKVMRIEETMKNEISISNKKLEFELTSWCHSWHSRRPPCNSSDPLQCNPRRCANLCLESDVCLCASTKPSTNGYPPTRKTFCQQGEKGWGHFRAWNQTRHWPLAITNSGRHEWEAWSTSLRLLYGETYMARSLSR